MQGLFIAQAATGNQTRLIEITPLAAVPLLIGILLSLPFLLSLFSPRIRGILTRFSLYAFGDYVDESPWMVDRREVLHAAHFQTTYRVYAARVLLYTLGAIVTAGFLGVYLVVFLVLLVRFLSQALQGQTGAAGRVGELLFVPDLPPAVMVLLFLVSSVLFGSLAGVVTYWFMWYRPQYEADRRSRQIEEGLPHAISLMYALSRGGVSFPKIMGILADNKQIYGETASEVETAIRDMDVFGRDLFSSIRQMAYRTPSTRLEDFSDNLITVLQGGLTLEGFLKDQYEMAHQQVRDQQENLLELIGTLAEGYVAALVAGPLFLITILVIMGLVMQDTLMAIRAIVYLVIPLASLFFIVYLDTVMESLQVERTEMEIEEETKHLDDVRRMKAPDEEEKRRMEENEKRFELYLSLRRWLKALSNPVKSLKREPWKSLYLTFPVSVLYLELQVYGLWTNDNIALGTVDDYVIHAVLLMLGTFAILQELKSRRDRAIDRRIGPFLDQLANVNQAGRTLAESIERVSQSELGVLTEDVQRTWKDIQWRGSVKNAMFRLDQRLRTPTFRRLVILVTSAMSASGDLQEILRIAADDAERKHNLQRRLREAAFSYLVVIYVAFFVFLGIIVVMHEMFIPQIPSIGSMAAQTGGGGSVPGIGGGGAMGGIGGGTGGPGKDAYSLALFHSAIVHAVFSGFVAGKMGEGSAKNGAKHATFMLLSSYLLMAFLGG